MGIHEQGLRGVDLDSMQTIERVKYTWLPGIGGREGRTGGA